MIWQIKVSEEARKELRALDHQIQRQIFKYLRERIETNEDPRRFGKALTSNKMGLWRYRVRDYRIICDIQDAKLTVLVLHTDHRKKVYED